MELMNEEVILLDESGQQVHFEHILTFLYENERYVALSPLDEGDADEADVYLFEIVEKDGEDTYVSIDNEVIQQEVFEAFLELMEEIEAEGQEDGGD